MIKTRNNMETPWFSAPWWCQRKVCYLREICEPLFKPGDLTVDFLKAIGGDNVATFEEAARREPKGASRELRKLVVLRLWPISEENKGDICRYLWKELQAHSWDFQTSMKVDLAVRAMRRQRNA